MSDPTAFGYGGLKFSWGDHICTVFEHREQQMEVMVPFFAEGLRAGQRCVWVSPGPTADLFRRKLAEAGGDLPSLEASDQLLIIPDIDYYLPNGIFSPERTLALANTLYEDSLRQGYTGIRAAGDCSWAAEHLLNLALWEKYEEEFGQQLSGKPLVVVCQYDIRRFPMSYVAAALRTHPIVIVGETVRRSPFFPTEPETIADQRQVH